MVASFVTKLVAQIMAPALSVQALAVHSTVSRICRGAAAKTVRAKCWHDQSNFSGMVSRVRVCMADNVAW